MGNMGTGAGGADPVAVLGIGCRFPGAAGPDAFWALLRDGVDAVTEVPPERWDADAFYEPGAGILGKMNTRHGGFLADVDRFDPAFFGLSPRGAAHTDPQQRLLLETAWEALEDAGMPPAQIAGSEAGVYVGIAGSDYSHTLREEVERLNAYFIPGNAMSVVANRLSQFYDLRGPSLAIDTGCSSSLVAVHAACQALQTGEADLALAGGVNLLLSPHVSIAAAQLWMLAPDGRTRAFDDAAGGYVRSEGCALIVLKRLADARRDGNRVLAVLRGSAVAHHGRADGLGTSTVATQAALIRRAQHRAGVQPSQVDYVEAHGSGIRSSDDTELRALQEVFAPDRPAGHPCLVGSVKTNIGYPEAAAGIAGLIKVLLALEDGELPPNLHLDDPSPTLIECAALRVVTARHPWLAGARPRLAGISSFGFGGTGAHLVVEEAPPVAPPIAPASSPPHLLVLSARDEAALRRVAARYADWLVAHPDVSSPDLCWSANTGRAHLAHRLAAVFDTPAALGALLAQFAAGARPAGLSVGVAPAAPDGGYPATEGEAACRPGPDERRELLERIAARYLDGWPIDCAGWETTTPRRRLRLPTYPFARQRCWL